MVVESLQPREGRNTSERGDTERRIEIDEGGDGKADVNAGVMAGSGQRCGKGRGRMGRGGLSRIIDED